jgi:predicted DCC family thiol-disulfide oxidoreductase YuxK
MAAAEPLDTPPAVEADYVVLFDGLCVLCHTGMRQLMALDSDELLHYSPLQGETAKAFGINWDNDATAGSQTFVFVDNSGPEPIVHERMRAVRAELEVIGRLRVLCWLLKVTPLPISNLGYRLIAATRYRLFGTYDECPLPHPKVRSRFLP